MEYEFESKIIFAGHAKKALLDPRQLDGLTVPLCKLLLFIIGAVEGDVAVEPNIEPVLFLFRQIYVLCVL